MPMTPRERVLATLAHDTPDRVPIVLGPSNATGIKMVTYRKLKALAGIDAPDEYLYDWPELGTARLDEVTARRLHADVRPRPRPLPGRRPRSQRDARAPEPDDRRLGQRPRLAGPDDWFPGIHPLADAYTPEEIEAYPWPDMTDPPVRGRPRRGPRLRDENVYASMGTPWLAFPLERAFAMQGTDNFLANLAGEPEFAEALLWKTQALCKTLMDGFLRECGDLIDMVKIGDDLGSQVGLLMSPAMYRRMLKPIHADLIAFIRRADEGGDRVPHGWRRVRPARRLHRDRRRRPQPGPGVGRRHERLRGSQAAVRRQPGVLRRDRHPPRAARTDRRTRSAPR